MLAKPRHPQLSPFISLQKSTGIKLLGNHQPCRVVHREQPAAHCQQSQGCFDGHCFGGRIGWLCVLSWVSESESG